MAGSHTHTTQERPPDLGALDATVVERLDDADLRYTAGRRAIVGGLRAAAGPVTLPELLASVPELATSSAYRNLGLLETAGVVRRIITGNDHARYELAESLTEHHHHLVCVSCGLIRDVTLPDQLERQLDARFGELADAEGFVLTDHAIDLHGLCPACTHPK